MEREKTWGLMRSRKIRFLMSVTTTVDYTLLPLYLLLCTAPLLVYYTQSGLSRTQGGAISFRSIDLGEVAFRPYPT